MTPMDKHADTDYPIHGLLARRWSPRAFADRPVDLTTLASLFEAARWSASCFNEQPWRFIVARREDGASYERLLACLTEGNQRWARQAPVLALGLAKRTFTEVGRPNAHARHDLGIATAQLVLQTTALGLHAHIMAGILPDKAREQCGVPEDFDVVTGLALGYLGDAATLPETLRDRELAPRHRRPLTELVFTGAWGNPTPFT
jgi:nitroreductase